VHEGSEESRASLVVPNDGLVEVVETVADLLLGIEEGAHAGNRATHEVRGRHSKRLTPERPGHLPHFLQSTKIFEIKHKPSAMKT
jgi:hypothetical protein